MGAITIKGATSGGTTITAPATGGDESIELSTVLASKADYPSGGSDGNVLVKSGTTAVWGTASPHANSATASVATSQTTTSTTYTDLATAGPSVTITTGTKALVIIGGSAYNETTGASAWASFAVSGASTVTASDTKAIQCYGIDATEISASRVILLTGLTAGSNTFTAKYRSSGGTSRFGNRDITVIDMGS